MREMTNILLEDVIDSLGWPVVLALLNALLMIGGTLAWAFVLVLLLMRLM